VRVRYFSIVLPLYNKETTVARAINSVLVQTHINFELIIVNDGSTDSSARIVHEYHDDRIRVVEQTNQGVSVARNEGVLRANHEWVAFLDADDEYQPLFLERIAEFIHGNANRTISFISSNITYGTSGCSAILNVQTGLHNYFKLCKHDQTPATSSSTVVKRTAFLAAGGFQVTAKQLEDWNLWCRLAWVGEYGFICEALSRYHISGSGTASTSERHVKEYYTDIVALPKTMREWSVQGKIATEMLSDSWKYVNLYLVGQSRLLRRKRARFWAFYLLREMNPRYIDTETALFMVKTFILLLLPLGLRDAKNRLLSKVIK
jgi:glycosyltransferase involved in cell wall biosynthesis